MVKSKWESNGEQEVKTKFTLIMFICSILIIWIHTFNLEVYGINESSTGLAKVVFHIESYWSKVTQIAVPLFFMISGILFFRTFEIHGLVKKWKKRFLTVVIPYLIWCTLYYLYYVICTNVPMISGIMSGAERVTFSVGEWISWLWMDRYYTLWFLQNLIYSLPYHL